MTITINAVRDEYTANAGQTVFDYTFKIYANDELTIYVTPAGQTADDSTDITTSYTVDPGTIGSEDGGFITFGSPLNAGDLVTIISAIPYDRTVDYQNNGDFRPETVNGDNDRQVSQIKQLVDLTGRTLQFQNSAQNQTSLSLPDPEASLFMRWKGDLTGLENVQIINAPATADGSVIYYTNVAAMKLSTSADILEGITIVTQGRITAGDGGGADYIVAGAQAVDEFGDHTLNGGLVALLNDPISFRNYGGVDDSVTDSTNQCQAAIDRAIALSSSVDISGNYAADSISLDGASGLLITGRGSIVGISAAPLTAFMTMKNVVNIAAQGAWFINANYNTNYDNAMWIYTDGVGQAAAFLNFSNLSPVNAKNAYLFGNPDRPSDLVSEISIFGGQTFGCPSVVRAVGAQTVVNFTGCTLASLTGSGDAAWQALPQRVIVADGATVNVSGGEMLHVLLSTGGTSSEFNALCVSGVIDLGGSAQYGKISINGSVVESAARFGATENVSSIPSPVSGYLSFTGCQGVSTNISFPVIETGPDFIGVVRVTGNNFFASAPRSGTHIQCGGECDIYLDDGSLGDNFVDHIGGTVGGILHFGYQMVVSVNNLAALSIVGSTETKLNFTVIETDDALGRWSSAYNAGAITVPPGGWESVRIETQLLLGALTGEFYIKINSVSLGVRKLVDFSSNSCSIKNLAAGDVIEVFVLNTGPTIAAGSVATDWFQVFARA